MNAPATFQRMMNLLFGHLLRQGVLVYLDDVLIHAPTMRRSLDLLREVLHILQEENHSMVSVPSEWGSLCALIHYVLHEKIQSCVCASPMSSCLNVSSISQQRDEVIKDCRRLRRWV